MVTEPLHLEAFVDAEAIAEHVGRDRKTILRLARLGVIPGYCDPAAERKHWLFKLSEVDAALKSRYAPASFPCRNLEGEELR
jgi:hypothetical protein